MVQSVGDRPYADPAAAKRLLEIANTIEARAGHIHVEKVNGPFVREGGLPGEYGAGINWLIAEGLISMHDSGGYFSFTDKGAQRFS